MRKILIFTFFLIVSGFIVYAQSSGKAHEILTSVSKKYKGYKSIQADFKYLMEIPKADGKGTDKQEYLGTMYIKGNKFKLDMGDMAIYCNGEKVWTHMKNMNEVQVDNYDPKSLSITPTEIFTMYDKNFIYVYQGEKVHNSKSVHMIDLAPNDKALLFFKVKLLIDKVTNTIVQSKVYQKDGTIHTVDINKQTPNLELSDSYFMLDKGKMPKVKWTDLSN
ncbi:MAG: outer membrane lipoprotein carrier protein LolA [Bacteroidota bacterium]|nr:outer membrane lipoprotein carrier protein LolA [Bacteroidota bacterium]